MVDSLQFSKKEIKKLPFIKRVFVQNLSQAKNLEQYSPLNEAINNLFSGQGTIPFFPSRILAQDFTGVPLLVDLVSMRNNSRNPESVNPKIPLDLVIDHSMQVDYTDKNSVQENLKLEFKRNHERYQFLKWCQQNFDNLTIIPPSCGIIHQINLEYFSKVFRDGKIETVLGTDSHTTMSNALGVLSWGVGGIEATACLLGEPTFIEVPQVIGVHLQGKLPAGITATDLALTLTKKFRDHGVVAKYLEFFGDGVRNLSIEDRAVIANMTPEYGATVSYFPIDFQTIDYLHRSNRDLDNQVKSLAIENNLWVEYEGFGGDEVSGGVSGESDFSTQNSFSKFSEINYDDVIEFDLSQVKPVIAGPSKPQQLLELNHQDKGKIAIASITSCTNTANPYLIFKAALVAQKAVELGYQVPEYVKTSFIPGSKLAEIYLENAGLLEPLAKLGFNINGFACATCIGNSGPIKPELVDEDNLVAVLSGNRNFEGRINPLVKSNYLMSPDKVILYALNGYVNENVEKLRKELEPDESEILAHLNKFETETLKTNIVGEVYQNIETSNPYWNELTTTLRPNLDQVETSVYEFIDSEYIKDPKYFERLNFSNTSYDNLTLLAVYGDSITTDHISPAGKIAPNSPAANYLTEKGIDANDFNSYGSRRGNHEVMMRGTYANIRIQNLLPNSQLPPGPYTFNYQTNQVQTIFDFAQKFQNPHQGLIVIAGKDYGMGSSRDWAAKGPMLLGVKVIIAESFERIHRSNLNMMGILPLEFLSGENFETLNLDPAQPFSLQLSKDELQNLQPNQIIKVKNGTKIFETRLKLYNQKELEYFYAGNILKYLEF